MPGGLLMGAGHVGTASTHGVDLLRRCGIHAWRGSTDAVRHPRMAWIYRGGVASTHGVDLL